MRLVHDGAWGVWLCERKIAGWVYADRNESSLELEVFRGSREQATAFAAVMRARCGVNYEPRRFE